MGDYIAEQSLYGRYNRTIGTLRFLRGNRVCHVVLERADEAPLTRCKVLKPKREALLALPHSPVCKLCLAAGLTSYEDWVLRWDWENLAPMAPGSGIVAAERFIEYLYRTIASSGRQLRELEQQIPRLTEQRRLMQVLLTTLLQRSQEGTITQGELEAILTAAGMEESLRPVLAEAQAERAEAAALRIVLGQSPELPTGRA